MKSHICLLSFLIIFCACNSNQNETKPAPLVKKNTDTLISPKENKKDSPNIDNKEELIGYWFFPHGAVINIKFLKDGNFLFNDFNSKLMESEQLSGKYELHDSILTLIYNDRPKQKFKFHKGKGSDDNYYIERKGYYFVKGEE